MGHRGPRRAPFRDWIHDAGAAQIKLAEFDTDDSIPEEVGGGCLSVHRGMGGSSPGRRVRGIGGKSVPPPPPHLPTLPDEPDHL